MAHSPQSWINAAGGYREVAQRLGENPTTVHNWTRAKHFPVAQYRALRALAVELALEPPDDKLFAFKAYPRDAEAARQ